MKSLALFALATLLLELHTGVCQQPKRKEDLGENRIKPGGRKRTKVRYPKVKEKEGSGKAGSLLTQVLDKGRFLRLGETLTLSPGKTMELRCKGTHIGWAYPSYLDTFNDTRLTVKQQEKFGQLILTSPSAADTGEYSCWPVLCDGDECHKDTDRLSATYIYFTDKDELFVPSPMHFEIVYMRPDAPAIVPCRVTSPSAQVSLHREVPAEEVPADGVAISYKPTKGFILQNPSPENQGAYYCKGTIKSTPQVSTKYMLLYVEVPSGPPYASLEPSAVRVTAGDTFNITCTVLGEPEVDVSFTWSFPGEDTERPVVIHDEWRLVNRGMSHTTRISKSVITVEDVEESIDLGRYICTAKNKHGATSVAVNMN
ncbi:platelet-derived growth factor receptor-like protein [Engraulis encrasicolus]|uniref:platelet-derived growth factor receptor-like protein n=1 Tax=Engraulis encrasicolus TaxID=184585 RepID=UPI002FD11AF9